jgi:hypothetical protein
VGQPKPFAQFEKLRLRRSFSNGETEVVVLGSSKPIVEHGDRASETRLGCDIHERASK